MVLYLPDNLMFWIIASLTVLSVSFVLVETSTVARRVFFDFVFLIALPLVVIVGWGLVGLAHLTSLPIALWQALIAGLAVAGGWLAGAIFKELDGARTKAERLRDYHKALYAEIRNALSVLWADGQGEAQGAATLSKMRNDPTFVPFIPKERYDYLYEAVIDKIEVLPRQTIDAIVAYYSQIKSVGALADDMRGETFQTLPPERRVLVYEDYLQMRIRAFSLGQHALRLIKAYADGGPAKAEALSSRDEGRTDHQQGSA